MRVFQGVNKELLPLIFMCIMHTIAIGSERVKHYRKVQTFEEA